MNVVDRFLKYVAYDTESDENSTTFPSTEKQKVLGRALAEELTAVGLSDVRFDDFGYVYAVLPATKGYEDRPVLGFLAHMDTSSGASGAGVKARIVSYSGGVLEIGNGKKLDPAFFPSLERYRGQELIVTDGTTLLGADDKAGIAEIMAAVEELCRHPEIPHGKIAVAFTPDEEVGGGMDHFSVAEFGAQFAYTIDGGELGEIEYENFNAASATLRVNGLNIHPGSAKNKMKNAVLMAMEWLSHLPPAETPAHTEGYEGFYHVTHIEGEEPETTVSLIIRDHDMEKFQARKRFLEDLTAYENRVWGAGSFELSLRDSYFNMKEKILPHMELIENAEAAMRKAGVEPLCIPIRGGTDGSRLSFMGVPCPNLSTGGANFHGVHEYIPVRSMEKMAEVILNLARAD